MPPPSAGRPTGDGSEERPPADPPAATVTTLSAEAQAEWTRHVEQVLRGVAHALNNRAAALSAVIELSTDPADDASVTSSILATELERVRDLVEVVRLVGTPREGVEAFAPRDAATHAMRVLAMHATQRDMRVLIDAGDAPPIRVPRWMFVRALIALAVRASEADPHAAVKIVSAEEGDWLVTRGVHAKAADAPVSPLVRELANAMGGAVLESQDGFRVPTLAALRRREAR